MTRPVTLTVHYLRISQSERIVWLCEELGLDYAIELYDRRAGTRLAPDEYKALHPMGTAPVITDGDLVLGESGAICEYIDRKYGGSRLSPGVEDPDFAGHLFWFHFSDATFMTNGMMALAANAAGAQSGLAGDFDQIRRRLVAEGFDLGHRLRSFSSSLRLISSP